MQEQLNPLGELSLERYESGGWPAALLERMAYWVRRMHTRGRLLDLGCAEGFLLDRLQIGGIGADMNAERLRIAKQRGLKVCLADGGRLPFPDASFDTVICMEVLEHVPDMRMLIHEVHRVLRPGGHWVISVPNVTLRSYYEMWREKRPYYCDENEHFCEFSAVSIPWFEHRFMLVSELEHMLQGCGFSVRHRDGVRYLFPQWFSRLPFLQSRLESPAADRVWARMPKIRAFPYWIIRVVRKD